MNKSSKNDAVSSHQNTHNMNNDNKVIFVLAIFFFISIFSVITFYIMNFHNASISKTPSDWGVLGDYFGGVLNPLISIFTLAFLIKTYLTQRHEMQDNENYLSEQLQIANRTAKNQLLQTKISACYEILNVYHLEMERVTNAKNANNKFIGMDGVEYWSNADQDNYRLKMANKIKIKIDEIDNYLTNLTE
ncbi:hypothetical protein M0K77_002422 [Providencia rettgeri]|uniref:Uncharacterized protein n=1 Tax=Providencia rettgeri TaxID=587 RepID=A0AAD2VR51_PRORE|nr:hypothetical protein [Providencia rettgeri]ELR5217899.1 hypothetical protein [Providencia rettgeri]